MRSALQLVESAIGALGAVVSDASEFCRVEQVKSHYIGSTICIGRAVLTRATIAARSRSALYVRFSPSGHVQLLGADDALASIVSLMHASAAAVREQALFVLSVLLTRERAQLLAPAAPINVLPLLLPLLREGGAAAEGTRLNAAVCLMHLSAPALNLERLGTREVVEALRRLAGKEHLPGPGTPTAASRLPSTPERMRRVSLARAQTPDRSAQQVCLEIHAKLRTHSADDHNIHPVYVVIRTAEQHAACSIERMPTARECIACASLHRPDQFVRSFVRSQESAVAAALALRRLFEHAERQRSPAALSAFLCSGTSECGAAISTLWHKPTVSNPRQAGSVRFTLTAPRQ
jgi:hypothetical protein